MSAFSPNAVGTYRFTVGTTAMTVTLPVRPGTIRVFNNTPANILYIEIGGATAVVPVAATGTGAVALAASGSMPLAGGAGSIPLLLERVARRLLAWLRLQYSQTCISRWDLAILWVNVV